MITETLKSISFKLPYLQTWSTPIQDDKDWAPPINNWVRKRPTEKALEDVEFNADLIEEYANVNFSGNKFEIEYDKKKYSVTLCPSSCICFYTKRNLLSFLRESAKSVINSIGLVVIDHWIDEHMNNYQPKREVKNKAEEIGEPIPVQYIPRKPHPNSILVLEYLLASYVVNPLDENSYLSIVNHTWHQEMLNPRALSKYS